MAYNDPGNPHRPDDYIDRSGDMGWTPIALGVAFLIVLGLLLFGAPKSADQRYVVTPNFMIRNPVHPV